MGVKWIPIPLMNVGVSFRVLFEWEGWVWIGLLHVWQNYANGILVSNILSNGFMRDIILEITSRSNKGGMFVEISKNHNGAKHGCLHVPEDDNKGG